ncbi:lipid-A-disaccharide synthase [Pseudooceanicola sp.]|uniref:lipid-A-disaccharide synthase n=1 Tax=Pseudooceanicola sp. TaxID=1914328 RepID=UPI00261913B2|nr:lipid-A-disaccharide synthase [Pseudooceanicola sp.]MDF1855812.1 lipid-A-disaccharide synthase [Pseudooceanicola sp.]
MRVFLVAGEPSGDALGAALMAGLRSLCPEVSFAGVGGPLMQAQGLESLFPMTELSVMGLAEVLPRYPALRRRLSQVRRAVLAQDPDLLITIDSPEFNLRLARAVKARSAIRVVHYVAPSVWAWRPQRAARLRGSVDQVLALLPFEPPLIEAAGVACDFVGHPAVSAPQASVAQAAAFRLAQGLGDAPILLLLPGSRRAEVSRLMPVFGAALSRIRTERPDIRAVLPAAPSVAGLVTALSANWPVTPLILDPREMTPPAFVAQKRAAFQAADLALAASGSVSLELAAAQVPMVIAYDMHWLSRVILKRLLRIDTVTLVNLVAESRTVPEFLGHACKPAPIAEAVLDLFDNSNAQQAALALCMARLGQGDEAQGLRAARAVLAGLEPKSG